MIKVGDYVTIWDWSGMSYAALEELNVVKARYREYKVYDVQGEYLLLEIGGVTRYGQWHSKGYPNSTDVIFHRAAYCKKVARFIDPSIA